jgi:hypothetical protein
MSETPNNTSVEEALQAEARKIWESHDLVTSYLAVSALFDPEDERTYYQVYFPVGTPKHVKYGLLRVLTEELNYEGDDNGE